MNDIEKRYKSQFDFEESPDPNTYERNPNFPGELQAAVGQISIEFQSLEDTISEVIIELIEVERDIGEILTVEMSFKNKVNLLGSLLHKLKSKFRSSFESDVDQDLYYKYLIKALFKCEELRNQTLHSTIAFDIDTNQLLRKKTSSKAKKVFPKLKMKSTSIIC
ncbi:MAG: hypothetical protein AAGA43_12500 [Bacteroidota bacterium]